MFMYSNNQPDETDLDSLFPREARGMAPGKAEVVLQSHIITGFEEALELGMAPTEALSQVLGWVASEMARINAACQTPGAALSGSARGE
jgi:hypothetical protein